MATSSILHNFILSNCEDAERFADAIEQSYRNPVPIEEVRANWITGHQELEELMSKRRKANA